MGGTLGGRDPRWAGGWMGESVGAGRGGTTVVMMIGSVKGTACSWTCQKAGAAVPEHAASAVFALLAPVETYNAGLVHGLWGVMRCHITHLN
jgi:hypothetical protein